MSVDTRFVGRGDERRSFQRLLDNPYGRERLKFIWGPGGIGKTWLVRAILADARKHEKYDYYAPDKVVDTYSTSSRHIEGVIEAIVTLLKLPITAFATYWDEKEKLDKAREQEGYAETGLEAQLSALATAFRHDLQQVVQARPAVIAFDTFEHVQNTPIGRWILSEEGLQIPGLLCIVAGRKPNPFDPDQPPLVGLNNDEALNFYKQYFVSPIMPVDPSEEMIADIYWLNEKERADGNPLLLGLALLWLENETPTKEERATVAGAEFQRRLANWLSPVGVGRKGLLLPNIVPQSLDEPLRQALVCIAYLNRRVNYMLLERLIQSGYVKGTRPGKIKALELWSALTDNLPEFFYVKDRPEGEIQLHDKLAEMLRLNILPDAFDDPNQQKARQFATDVVDWYDELIAKATNDQQKAIFQVEKLAYAMRLDVLTDIQQPEWKDTPEAKRLAQLLPPDFEKAKELITEYRQQHSDVLNRMVVNEIPPDLVDRFPLVDHYELYSLLGEMARDAYLLEESADYWHHAFEAAKKSGDVSKQVVALRWESNSTWQHDSSRALELLDWALDICKDVRELTPQILYSIGFVHRQMHNLETAVEWYEKALESAKRYDSERLMTPTILNDMGYALLLIGQYDKAEAHIKMAALLRERNRDKAQEEWDKIKDQVANESDPTRLDALRQLEVVAKEAWRDATLKLGMTYNTLGQLARQNPSDVADATGHYAEALSIFRKLNDLRRQAHNLQAKGDALRRLALDLFFKERHESSQNYDQQAFNDIEASLNYCRDYGIIDLLPIVHRRMGRLMHDRALRATHNPGEQIRLIQEALEQFEASIKAAKQTQNTLEELESSTEIAFLADDLIHFYRRQRGGKPLTKRQREEVQGHIEQFRQVIEAHRDDEPRIYHFPVFDDLYKIEQGAFYYELGDLDKAFTYYLEGYTGLASDPGYGSARCRAHFEHLLGNLRKLPDPQIKQSWYQKFIDTWKTTLMKRIGDKTIAEAHPKLIEQLELHQMFE